MDYIYNKVKVVAGIFLLLLSLYGCKPQVPDEYIQPNQFEDILYDYHLAIAMGNQQTSNQVVNNIQKNAYILAALKKHNVSEADFDKSYQYYLRHTERLHDIYEGLAKRLSNEAGTLGSSVNELNQYGTLAQKGDTTNIWSYDRSLVLSTNDYLNQMSFNIKADTAFHKGDKLILNFDTKFIIQDGTRDAVAMFVVQFQNDSIYTQVGRITGDTHQSLSIFDNNKLGIKSVRCFFIFNHEPGVSLSTLKLLCIYNIELIRMHMHEQNSPVINSSTSDSTNRPMKLSLKDSVNKTP